ncbi:hypothetical protein B0H14DRAFT_3538893 [Mycena olivaceomarginata]|nr:hypothetical protein B0H14DRAFT_3538893 [Mycena olivaceomarginata]
MHSARRPPCSYTVLVALPKIHTILIACWFRSPFPSMLTTTSAIPALNFDHHHRDAPPRAARPAAYSYTKLVALPYSPYKLDGPGHLSFPLRGTVTSDIDAFPRRHRAHSSAIRRPRDQSRAYRQDSNGGSGRVPRLAVSMGRRPLRSSSGALLCPREAAHRAIDSPQAQAERASLLSVPCHGCTKNHREFYSLAGAGGICRGLGSLWRTFSWIWAFHLCGKRYLAPIGQPEIVDPYRPESEPAFRSNACPPLRLPCSTPPRYPTKVYTKCLCWDSTTTLLGEDSRKMNAAAAGGGGGGGPGGSTLVFSDANVDYATGFALVASVREYPLRFEVQRNSAMGSIPLLLYSAIPLFLAFGNSWDPDAPLWVRRLPMHKPLHFPQPLAFVAKLFAGMTDIPRGSVLFGQESHLQLWVRNGLSIADPKVSRTYGTSSGLHGPSNVCNAVWLHVWLQRN